MEFQSDRWVPDAQWRRVAKSDGDMRLPGDVPVREVRDLAELLELVRQHGESRIDVPSSRVKPRRFRLSLGPSGQ